MLRKNAKLELLKQVPLFAGLSKRELELVASIADEVDVDAGVDLTKEGARGAEFMVIAEGSADVRRRGCAVNRLETGDFLGEIALISGEPRTATVTTTAPSRLLVVTSKDFKRLLRETPTLQGKILEAICVRLRS